MSNWNDNRARTRKSPSKRSPQRGSNPRSPGEVATKSPAEPVKIIQDEPLLVDIKSGHAIPVVVTSEPEEGSILWLVASGIAIAGLLLIIFLPMPSINHQIFWAIALLNIVVAVKR